MSRSYKDRPSKLRFEPYDKDYIEVEHYGFSIYRKGKTTKTKKRKEVDTENHWMTTPSWWNNLFHTRPIRGNFRTFLTSVVKSDIAEIENMLEPTDSKSPHVYYW